MNWSGLNQKLPVQTGSRFGHSTGRGLSSTRQEGFNLSDQEMGGDAKKTGCGASTGAGGGGFRAKLDNFLYSGDKKHVVAGIAIIGVLFGVPWYLMNRGTKHQSHQDYMERADKARSERLSTGSSSAR